MDFSNNAFRTRPPCTLSDDNMSHTKLVQACRFDWAAGPEDTAASTPLVPAPAPVRASFTTPNSNTRTNRLTPCRGRLYHQLTCSHRIRTDLVDDCGPNCVEPQGVVCQVPFYCKECVEKESTGIWKTREATHNALYPPMEQMTPEVYNTWYDERRRLEADLQRDRQVYEFKLKANTRPTNICSALEMSQEEADIASELDSLSLLMASNESTNNYSQPQRHRFSLPNDASEQLHWGLNSLALDRGSCGVEYSSAQRAQQSRTMNEEELWKQAREHD
jgi:hypothetical protein